MSKAICFVIGGLSGGGQERALTNLANEFARRDYKIALICLFKTEVFFEIHPNIKVIWPNYDRKSTNKFAYALKLVPYIRRNIIQENPDKIVSFGDWFNAYVILSTRFLNKPVYITNRMGPNLYLGKFMEFFNRLTYKKATAMIVQTNMAKEIMEKKYGLKDVRIVANAVKPVDIKHSNPEKAIITVGRLSKEKGHSILIDAFSKLQDKEWRLDIVGDGPEMDNLKRQSMELNLENRILFHGHMKDFDDLLSKASIFVLPSFYEGFPNALLEAMSVPIVCVASDCIAGPRDIIEDGVNGYLFETGNSLALSKIISNLIQNEASLTHIRNSAFEVRNKYNFQKISSEFLKNINYTNEDTPN